MKKTAFVLLLIFILVNSTNGQTTTTVKIGTQSWCTQNLNVSTYRNGDPIPQMQDGTKWAALKTGAWCYYENNAGNGATYGKLYNLYAVMDPRGLAPAGFHIPTDAEWTKLTTYLKGESAAGAKMKSTTGWEDSDGKSGNGNNSSGFNGFASGYRSEGGGFANMGFYGYWWCTREGGTGGTWYRNLRYDSDVTNRKFCLYSYYGYSVRCIAD
jgi:uncharacterized protein (TIGR02145 family)